MTLILKNGEEAALKSLSARSMYNELVDFNALECELLLWKHAKESENFQEALKTNRSNSFESQRIRPKLLSTREEKIKIQDAKLARLMTQPYSTYEIYKVFYKLGMAASFPQINVLFDIYLAIPVSSASAERAFSALKRIKNWMRSTMGQERLSNLAILNIERELTEATNIQEAIKVFASRKDRRCQF